MAFDINLPPTPPEDSPVRSWALWVVRAQAAVAFSLTADTASVVARFARDGRRRPRRPPIGRLTPHAARC